MLDACVTTHPPFQPIESHQSHTHILSRVGWSCMCCGTRSPAGMTCGMLAVWTDMHPCTQPQEGCPQSCIHMHVFQNNQSDHLTPTSNTHTSGARTPVRLIGECGCMRMRCTSVVLYVFALHSALRYMLCFISSCANQTINENQHQSMQ